MVKRLALRVPVATFNQLAARARRRTVSVHQLVVEAIAASLVAEARKDGFLLNGDDRRKARAQLRDIDDELRRLSLD